MVISIIGQFAVYFLPDFPLRDAFAEEFNVDAEGNFPSLFSSFMLLSCSFFLSLIHRAKRQTRDRHSKSWMFLSYIFFYLSLDELLSLHERVIPFFERLGASGFFYHGWVILALIILPLLGLFFLKLWLSLPARIRTLFFISGAIYIGGALGIELLNGMYADLYGEENFFYEMLVTLEEVLEMFGLTVFIFALLSYLRVLNVETFDINVIFSDENN
ncbi:hypothetical protein [Nodosilinea sp. E11]|uniref:hypothetical protein n=1 Tax=Nodosilinea sp. E11 TaxID=3037479 RepID=UPI002934209F|nr:hypothetical protein [Nodosilinea sp. E11]WOD37414.1 hypothetical protein RRF56_14485 [Nodosilinea sp. E11]